MTIKQPLIGAHISIAKSMHMAFERGESIGCTAMQIFTKSCRILFGKPLKKEEVALFKQTMKNSSIQSLIAHAGYLINMCSNNPKTATQSTMALIHEINRCAELNIPYLVLHPGAHVGAGEEVGLELIAKNLDTALKRASSNVCVLLETMAHQGTTLGHTFEQLKKIRSICSNNNRIGICLDTCHIFAAGYDISTKQAYENVMKSFELTLGLSHLKAIHLNNSKDDLGSHVDRHAPITNGKIPLETFKLIMNDKRLTYIPKILETPCDVQMKSWEKEIVLLKQLIV